MTPLVLGAVAVAATVAALVAQRLFGGAGATSAPVALPAVPGAPSVPLAVPVAPAVQPQLQPLVLPQVSPAAIQAAVQLALAGHPALQSLSAVVSSPLAQAFLGHFVDQGVSMADSWLQQHAASFAAQLVPVAPTKPPVAPAPVKAT